MSKAQTQLLTIKGIISELPADQRAQVETAAADLRRVIKLHGEAAGLALALVGSETVVADEEKGAR
jgi:hypothetical protein